MQDNKSAHMSIEYDGKIRQTIPHYDEFHKQTINLISSINPNPEKWLDTGCGTGTFALAAGGIFKDTKFYLADPSKEMLLIAKEKIKQNKCANFEVLEPVPTQNMTLDQDVFDVVTAIQAHHYLNEEERRLATVNCLRMLKSGGVYITFENITPTSEFGINAGLNMWKQFQISKGKNDEEAQKHIERFGHEYFPITIEAHLNLLREVGFGAVEILWYSYMQAGFYAVK